MLRGLILLALCSLLSGCAAIAPASSVLSALPGGSPVPLVHEQTTVSLAQDNFVLVKTNVVGLSKGFSLLGFITIYPATLAKALDRMYGAAQLHIGEPQTVGQLLVQNSSSYWILFGIPKVEVHADVFQFNPAVSSGGREKPQRHDAGGDGNGG